MKKNHLLTTLLLAIALTACGGSGGGSSKAPDNSSSSSSTATADNSGLVFGEAINADWGHFSAFQWSPSGNTGKSYEDGQIANNAVQWRVIDSGSADHKSVVDVSFFSTADQSWGQFEVTPAADKDVSAYNTGKLSFDINVQEWGDTYDQTASAAIFDVRTECTWPCASHSNLFKVTQRGAWSHIEVSVAEMINDGLDPTHVSRAFIIKPMATSANGLRFQLDNIRWTKGTTKASTKKIVYAAHFNAYTDASLWVPSIVNGPTAAPLAQYVEYGLLVVPNIIGIYYNDWALENQLTAPININNKNISMEVYVKKDLQEGIGYLEFSAIDAAERKAMLNIQLNQIQADTWNRVSFNTGSTAFFADANFNPNNVQKIGIAFRSAYTPIKSNILGYTTIDEILITE